MAEAAAATASQGSSQGSNQGSAATGGGQAAGAATKGGEGGGQTIDATKTFERVTSLERELSNLRKQNQTQSDTLSRMRGVFAPDERQPAAPDPNEEFIETYLQAGLEAEKSGQPMPLTTNMAVKLYETNRELAQLRASLLEAQGRLQTLGDPNVTADNHAFTQMDAVLRNQLAGVYGQQDFDGDGQLTAGYAEEDRVAVADKVVKEIKRLKKDQPQVWDRIRQDPKLQHKMIKHFLDKTIPPQARQIMEREELKNQKWGDADYAEAFQEAKAIEDPKVRGKAMEKVRQEWLASRFDPANNQRRGPYSR